jgi:hypothetical protein
VASIVGVERDDDLAATPTRLDRWLWGVVFTLGGLLLLLGLTLASVAVITPDAFVDACYRPALVMPANCSVGSASAAAGQK